MSGSFYVFGCSEYEPKDPEWMGEIQHFDVTGDQPVAKGFRARVAN